MVDIVELYIQAGNGGDGRISFLRTRLQPKGGPDGGDGGKGGAIIVRGNVHMHTLRDFSGKHAILAQNGAMGGKTKKHGKDAEDEIVNLPVGTIIWKLKEDSKPMQKRMYWYDDDGHRQEGYLTRAQQLKKLPLAAKRDRHPTGQGSYIPDPDFRLKAEVIAEISKDGQELVIAKPGLGGRGNWQFRSSKHTTPMLAETGSQGEGGLFIFELQLLADIGLVGFPNVGKSTLLSVLTTAKPQIASYPFTTLVPNLGVLRFTSTRANERESLVVADIPGIIEGASEGKGLGIEFLRHIERTKVLVFVLAVDEYRDVSKKSSADNIHELMQQYEALEKELNVYEKQSRANNPDMKRLDLSQKPRFIVVNKSDLLTEQENTFIASQLKKVYNHPVFLVSGKTLLGIQDLKNALQQFT